jgi:hypothetical protein
MPGLRAGIHVLAKRKGVDGRVKPGHDGNCPTCHRTAPIARSTASLGQQSTLSPADFW